MPQIEKKSPWRYMDLGIQFAVAIGLCLFGGHYLDKKLTTSPLFLIIGVMLGAVAGFLNIYRSVYPRYRQNPEKTKNESK